MMHNPSQSFLHIAPLFRHTNGSLWPASISLCLETHASPAGPSFTHPYLGTAQRLLLLLGHPQWCPQLSTILNPPPVTSCNHDILQSWQYIWFGCFPHICLIILDGLSSRTGLWNIIGDVSTFPMTCSKFLINHSLIGSNFCGTRALWWAYIKHCMQGQDQDEASHVAGGEIQEGIYSQLLSDPMLVKPQEWMPPQTLCPAWFACPAREAALIG